MQNLPNDHGFNANARDESRDCSRAMPGILAGVALAAGTIVAATVVMMGIARAASLTNVVENDSVVFIAALLLGALFIASCLTKAIAPRRNERRSAIRSGYNQDYLSH
jgi:hypothetical protein